MKKPQETKTLLNQALGLNSQERTLLLEKINDTDLKSQVETLLADEQQRQAFLQQNNTTQPSGHSPTDSIGPGSLINRIRIIKLLGQGGMGSVYLGFDEKLERQVAVKSIRPEHLTNPATQQRFVREAQILSKINHPSICQLYDYLETKEGDFLVLEYIKGQPLYQTPLTDQQKLVAMADLSAALAVAHEHGIVHRDLKPDNVMITDEGQLKVLDFGIAQSLTKPQTASQTTPTKVSNELTQQGSLVGTIRYMSPEQAQGKNINTASDMYALGIIIQEVFSHQAAYQVMETEQLLADVQQGKRAEANDLPVAISQLISRLTQLDAARRPTAQSTADTITSILDAPKRKKHKAITYSIIGIVVVLLMVLWWQWQQSNSMAASNDSVKSYENQINALVQQVEQIFVLPLHPVEDEIKAIEKQGELLYEKIANDQVLTNVDRNRLLGIILLKGEYYAEAIPLLTAGQAESHLLADAWTMLYIQKATEFSDLYGMEKTMNDSDLRDNYLKPTLKQIQQAQEDAGQLDPLFHAFQLSQTQSMEAGLIAVEKILAKEHWNKKAVNLKALILSASMTRAMEEGHWQQAKEFAIQTAETYQRSNQMARSYPASYISLCYVSLGLMKDGAQRSGQQVLMFTEQATKACENALILQPNNPYPKQLLTNIQIMKAQWELDVGIDANDSLTQAKHWNQKNSSLDNLYSNSWTQASIFAIEAKQFILNGQPSEGVIEQALKLFENLTKVNTEFTPYVAGDMLYVLALKAQALVRINHDPTDVIQQAQELFDTTMLIPDLMVSEQHGLINNMAQVYMVALIHLLENGHDILPQGEKLLAFLNPAENQLKDDPSLLLNLANTHLLITEYLRRQQQPINNHLIQAEKYLTQALAINPNNHNTLISQASLLALQSHFSEQNYSSANHMFQQAMTINPHNPYSLHTWAESLLMQAKTQVGTEQQKTLNDAHQKITMALSIDQQHSVFNQTLDKITERASANGVGLSQKQ